MNTKNQRRILITGATSGIGYQAALKLIEDDQKLVILCRNSSRVDSTIKSLRSDNIPLSKIERLAKFPIVDLSDLNSIEEFTANELSNSCRIDTLILNAGLQYTGSKFIRRSKQGIELTFAVNHLSHYYLVQRLISLLRKSEFPRVVITSSEVHNPNSPGGQVGKKADLSDLAGLRKSLDFEMIDGFSPFDADKAYKDSKLCNTLFSKELSRRFLKNNFNIPVLCWAPGLVIPTTKEGFFRYSRKYNELGQILFAFIARDLLHITESPQNAGKILFNLATLDSYQAEKFLYLSNNIKTLGQMILKEKTISKEANNSTKAENLWNLSGEIIQKFVTINPF